jgi:hypothetical protein
MLVDRRQRPVVAANAVREPEPVRKFDENEIEMWEMSD